MKTQLFRIIVFMFIVSIMSLILPVNTYAANECDSIPDPVARQACEASHNRTNTSEAKTCRGFLGFPAWYEGLTDENCNIIFPSSDSSSDGYEISLGKFVFRIALNVIQMAIMIVGYASAAFIIYGGIKYLMSRGAPDGISKGKTLIQNAIIGLVIALISIAIVNLIINGMGLGV